MAEPIRRALLSVWDKTGLAAFARGLAGLGVTLLATGGTAELLRREGLTPAETRDLTGFASLLGGRVKTLHPRVHAGILARRDHPEDLAEIRREEIQLIDMVVVNFYPFPGAEGGADLDFAAMSELMDIGGPALLRGAAKNCRHVVPVSRPDHYDRVLREMRERAGEVSWETRARLARDAFALASDYDREISRYLGALVGEAATAESGLPPVLWANAPLARELAYGENPHQAAGFYRDGVTASGLTAMEVLGGKPLSYNNLLDVDALWRLLRDFPRPTAAIVKHNTPCGVASADNVALALRQALACDREAAFGGVFGLNRVLSADAVSELGDLFVEGLVFPDAEPAALEALRHRKRVRILRLPGLGREQAGACEVRSVAGGYLVQEPDRLSFDRTECRVVSTRAPSEEEWRGLEFAWRVTKHVRSNAIVLARGEETVGIGAGQMSRVDSVRLACRKAAQAGHDARGAVLASDGFFPFGDNVEEAAAAGVTALIEPGGSVRDEEVIAAADRLGVALVFAGRRHFRH